MPSYFNDYFSIIYNGIYKVHEAYPEKHTKIEKAYSKALKKIITANYYGIYYASYILFTTLRWEKKGKSAFVVNLLHLEMLNDQIHWHMDELKKCTDYGGVSMLDDIERLDRILMDETTTSLFDRRYYILKKLNQALNPDVKLIPQDKVSYDYWDYKLCGAISEEQVEKLLDTLTTEEKGYCGLIDNYCIRIRQPYGWWRETCPPEIVR
jgi:hypothetical protein